MSVPDSRLRFGSQFAMTARLWRRTLDHRLAAAGITDASWLPLIRLDEAGDGLSQKQLAARVGLDGSTLVRLLDRLEAKGQVERRADIDDRRTKRLYLTASGRQAVSAIRTHLQRIESDMLVDLADDELDAMLAALALIQHRLNLLEEPAEPAP